MAEGLTGDLIFAAVSAWAISLLLIRHDLSLAFDLPVSLHHRLYLLVVAFSAADRERTARLGLEGQQPA